MKKTICTRTISLVCILALLVSLMVPSVSASSNSYFPVYTGNSESLVDGLNTIGVDSSFSFREEIAKVNGIDNYQGTADQNTALLQKLRNGVLIDPNATGTTFAGDVGGIKNGVTVTKDNAPLRATADGDDEILYRAEKGAVLELLGTKRTGFMGIKKWYKVSYKGSTYYLFGENGEVHSHNYTSYIVAGTHFKVCNCGHVAFTTHQKVEVKRMESYAALGTAAATAALADGPIPVGDIVGAVIVATGTVFLLTGELVSSETAQEIATDIDYVDYLKTVKNECNGSTYRMVTRTPGNLKIISDSCLNIGEAYIYVRYCGGDVWCTNSIVAKAVAELHESGYYIESDKDELSHYEHIHLGTDAAHKVGGHIFYGTNDLGQTPTF